MAVKSSGGIYNNKTELWTWEPLQVVNIPITMNFKSKTINIKAKKELLLNYTSISDPIETANFDLFPVVTIQKKGYPIRVVEQFPKNDKYSHILFLRFEGNFGTQYILRDL